jgi:hypothetical protein
MEGARAEHDSGVPPSRARASGLDSIGPRVHDAKSSTKPAKASTKRRSARLTGSANLEPLDYEEDPPPTAVDVNHLAARRGPEFNLFDCPYINCVCIGQDFCGVMKQCSQGDTVSFKPCATARVSGDDLHFVCQDCRSASSRLPQQRGSGVFVTCSVQGKDALTAVLSASTFLELEYLIVDEVGVHASDRVLATAVAEHLENSVSSEHMSHWHHINGAGGRAACSGKATPEIQPPAFSRSQLREFELRKSKGGGGRSAINQEGCGSQGQGCKG